MEKQLTAVYNGAQKGKTIYFHRINTSKCGTQLAREINAVPTIYTANCVMAEMVYVADTVRMENIYHVTKGTPATLTELQALWVILRDWESVVARLERTNNVSLVLISCTAMDAAGSPFYEAAVTPAIVGNNSAGSLPSILTVAVKHSSGLTGRSFRGRSYFIGLARNGLLNANAINSAYVTAITSMYTNLRTRLATGGWTLVVVSKYSGVDSNGKQIPRAAGVMTPILSSSVEANVDTMRKRKVPYDL